MEANETNKAHKYALSLMLEYRSTQILLTSLLLFQNGTQILKKESAINCRDLTIKKAIKLWTEETVKISLSGQKFRLY